MMERSSKKSEKGGSSSKKERMMKVKNQVLSMVPGQLVSPTSYPTALTVKRHVEMSSLTVEECELLGDAKYRTYISQVEKALKSFEYTSEWADLISALGKLNKVLLNYIKYPVVPKKVTIGKRLAQCLHPALPSGVHLKALETYDIIFKCIGTPRLAHDLFVYSAGLFPLMGHAAMNVKPALLDIYEKHFTQLGKQVKPGLNGLLLGLLPGLEEGSEYYDRTNSLLEKFCEAAGPPFFYTCLWECIMTCPSIRLPATMYLVTHYSKKRSMEDQLYLMGQNIDLMVNATCSAVQDTSVLVQRCVLDFMLSAFPMHNAQLTQPDTAKILNAALCVVLRRDMSLNRRLYAWLLGTDAAGNQLTRVTESGKKPLHRADSSSTSGDLDLQFFHAYSKDKLVTALNRYLSASTTEASHGLSDKNLALRPFRILISLLDKPEIGPTIIEDVLLEVFRCLYRECITKSAEEENVSSRQRKLERSSSLRGKLYRQDSQVKVELTKTANLLFGTLEPYFIWDFIARNFEAACKAAPIPHQHTPRQHKPEFGHQKEAPTLLELCTLVDFLLDIVSLETYLETTTEHLPDLLRHITNSLTHYCTDIGDAEITASLKLCAKILQKVQPSMNILGSGAHETTSDLFTGSEAGPEFVSTPASVAAKGDENETKEKEITKDSLDIDSEGEVKETTVSVESGSQGGQEVDFQGCDSSTVAEECSNDSVPPLVSSKVNAQTTETDHVDDITDLHEFQRYNAIEIERSPSRVSYRISGPLTLMQACVQSFQEFFHVFVSRRVLGDQSLSKKCLDQITVSQDSAKSSDRDSVLEGGSIYSQEEITPSTRCALSEEFVVSGDRISNHCCEALSHACKLLVDFSSFPMYCTDYHKLMDQTLNHDEEMTLPAWLQDLICCTCFVESFRVKTAAIATMLDLIILTQSVQSETESKGVECVTEGTVSVVILPFLLPKHLRFLNSSTLFYHMVAESLWAYLSGETTEHHQSSVELFHQLHQVNPSSWVCEDVIGNALINPVQEKRIEAYRKFTVLWHLTRDKRLETTPGRTIRTYDRSMFVLLDSLREETSPVQTVASTWVTHSVQRGDLGRILEPILLMLFHPDTARISIQHVNIHKPRKVRLSDASDEVESAEAKIYAISSEGGNVIYHVSAQSKAISKRNAEDLKSFALTVVNDKGSKSQVKTASTRAQVDMPFDRVNADNLNLRVNPFGTENVMDRFIHDVGEIPGVQLQQSLGGAEPPDLGSVKRLNKATCQKEGIVFEDRDSQDEAAQDDDGEDSTALDQPETTEQMVAAIIDDLVNAVVGVQEPIKDDVSIASTTPATTAPVVTEEVNPVPLRSTRESSVASKDNLSIPDEELLLNAIDRQGLTIDSPSGSEMDLSRQALAASIEASTTDIHTLHMHILLYTQKYDFQRTLYALTTLKSLLEASPRLVVVSMATSSISAFRTPHHLKVQTLLARHKKSVFGKNFFGEVPPENLSSCKSNMYLEVVVSVLLYFVRSYYPNLMMSKLTPEELMGNREVHILSTDILTIMMSELILITKDSGRSFASYVDNLLSKCKLQKALLHCVLASIYNARRRTSKDSSASSFTETIVDFNEENLDSSAVETFQIKLLELLQVMVRLEEHIMKAKGEQDSGQPNPSSEWERSRVTFQPVLANVRYNPVLPMVQQGMFLSGILSALKQQHLAHMHRHWIAMVTSSMPFMNKALSPIVVSVVSQLCRNLEGLAQLYSPLPEQGLNAARRVPPDHLLTMLEGLTTLCHYCLLDSTPQVSLGAPLHSTTTSTTEATNYASQIIFNLLHVFNPVSGKDSSPPRDLSTSTSPVMEARRALLSILPRIIACLATLWKAITLSNQQAMDTQTQQSNWTMGSPKIIQRYILDFLSPLSQSHGVSLLGAVAVAWNDSRQRKGAAQTKRVMSAPCDDQLLLVDLVSEIKVFPTEKLVHIVKQVMKQPPPSELTKSKKSVPLEVNLLQFFLAYIQRSGSLQLLDSWPSLLSLIKDGLQLSLSPPGQFLLLEILNEVVQKMPPMEDRKSQKELQEIVQKVLDAVSAIAGSCLEQTTWLRRNLAVKPGPQTDIHDVEDIDNNEESDLEVSSPPLERKVISPLNSNSEISKYSVQALTLLAERTASLLDVVYGSEEKEKAVPFITSIMYNVFPYLRNHSPHNLPSFRACSQFLASISGYQYTRKSWRKEALELLLDISFFQMDQKCIGYWETVIDNLMTHDKTTFKDLMSRVTVVQSGSLNLFSSKDQEYEQKALLLRRLAFTIFCSEPDQYQKNMPEIQERLSESLRLPQVPSLMSQVFLCFRVLILRMSPQHLTSLWPTIITEMVHVFLQIEQELSTETDEFKAQLQRIAALDSTWAHLGNGLNAHNNPAWLQLYLSACKLLDLALTLPADFIPQFQLYRWAFIGEDCTEDDDRKQKAWTKPTFVPHIIRITRLINNKVARECRLLSRVQGKPLLNLTYIRSLLELQPFFNTLAMAQQSEATSSNNNVNDLRSSMSKSRSAPEFGQLSARGGDFTGPNQYRTVHQYIEQSVERDFLEFLPSS